MIEIVDCSTTINIKIPNSGLTSEMLCKLHNIGKEKSMTFTDEMNKIRKEITDFCSKDKHTAEEYDKWQENINKLNQLLDDSKQGYGFSFHMNTGEKPEDCYYYIWNYNRIAPKEEVDYLMDKIREICNGIDLQLDCKNYSR